MDPANRYLVVVLPGTNGGGEEGGLADGVWTAALRGEQGPAIEGGVELGGAGGAWRHPKTCKTEAVHVPYYAMGKSYCAW